MAEAADGSWRVEIDDVADLDKKLGRPVLEALLGAMVWADRLAALIHFMKLSEAFARDGAVWHRNVGTAHFLAAGVLRELSTATKRLRRALHARGWYVKDDPEMTKLRSFELVWDGDRNLIDVRDHAAFHVSPEKVSAGLTAIIKDGKPLFVLHGDGSKSLQVYCPLAQEAIFHGLGFTDGDREHLMQATRENLEVAILLKNIFEGLLLKANIPLAKTKWQK